MESISRRDMLAATAAGDLLTAASVGARKPSRAFHSPGVRVTAATSWSTQLMRDGQKPRRARTGPPPITVRCRTYASPFGRPYATGETGGWTRQVTARDLGVSRNIAGVNIRLKPRGRGRAALAQGAEWAYLLYGNARITAVDAKAGTRR